MTIMKTFHIQSGAGLVDGGLSSVAERSCVTVERSLSYNEHTLWMGDH
jgi:hypothetical protein